MGRMTSPAEPDSGVTLADGRRLAYDDRGEATGAPVLFLHGTPDTRLARHPDDSIANDLGFRILAADRPGLGGSDPDPAADPWTVAADQVALLDHLALDRVHVVAWSAGSIHGVALAGAHPTRVRSLTLVAPLVPADAYDDEGVLDGSDDSRLLFAEHLGTMPPGDLGRELAMWLVPPEIDDDDARSILAESLVRVDHVRGAGDALVAAFRGTVAQGMVGLEREVAAQATVLGTTLDDVVAPVTVHVGRDDRLTPPAMGRWLAHRLGASVREHPAGHEIGITAWEEILRGIAAA